MSDRTAGKLLVENPLAKSKYHRIYWEIARHPDLTTGAKLTHALLVSYATMYDEVYPGMEQLAIDIGVSRHSVMRYMKELEESGLLQVDRPKGGRTNVYTLMDWTKKQSRKVQRSDLLRSNVERSSLRLSATRVEPSTSQGATHKRKEGEKESSGKKKEAWPDFVRRRKNENNWPAGLTQEQLTQLEHEYFEGETS